MRWCVQVRVDGTEVEAEISDDFSEADVASLTEWPRFVPGQDDSMWDWPSILAAHPVGADCDRLVLRAAGILHGIVLLGEERDLRLSVGRCRDLAYLAASPGDRKTAPAAGWTHPRVTPVGTVLMLAAIDSSERRGCGGALGWHSEPGAERWYRKAFPGIRCLPEDFDGERRLTYFEIDASQAKAYLRQHGNALSFALR